MPVPPGDGPTRHDDSVTLPTGTPSPFVGRAPDLAALVGLVGLPDGPGGAVLLGGDAGVGKTRLLAELGRAAETAGWRVLVGHCLDFGADGLPYLPFSEIFGRLAAEAPALARSVVERSPDVARLMPGRPADESAVTRATLLEALPVALDHLTRSAPVLLVLEDVHWADPSTRELLGLLLARRGSPRLAVVVSYRTDDLHRRHPLRPVLAEWSRLFGVRRMPLRPLDDTAVRGLVRALRPAGVTERDVSSIVARAEGNAFYAEELVAAVDLGASVLSADLADLLLVRLDRLDDVTRGVIRAAAVAGRTVSHAALAAVAGLSGTELEQAVRTAADLNVLVSTASTGYSFRHALLVEAVYEDLLPGERTRLHAAYAAALLSGQLAGTSAELARHARAARDLPTAVRASIAAGDEAMAVGGPTEAAVHYEQALELLAELPAGELQARDILVGEPAGDDIPVGEPLDIIDLVLRASEAAVAAGRLHRALALVRDRLAGLPADAPWRARARLLHAVASIAVLDDTPIDVLQVTAEALRLTPAEPPSALRAQILAAHARANGARGRQPEAARWAQEAVRIGRELGLPAVVAEATTTLANVERRTTPDVARRALQESTAAARAAGEVAAELRSTYNLGQLDWEMGRLEQAQAAFGAGAARATELGRPWAPYGVDSRSLAGIVAYVRGDWEATLRLTDVSGESPPALAAVVLGGVRLSVAAGRGEVTALSRLPGLRPWWERDGLIAVICGTAAIDLHGDTGDHQAAAAVHDDVVRLVTSLWEGGPFQARIRLGALLLGQLASAAGRESAVERLQLRRRGDAVGAAAVGAAGDAQVGGLGPESRAWLARVHAEQARLGWLAGDPGVDPADLVQRWEAALAAFTEFGHVFEAARCRSRLGAVLRAAGRPAEAEPHTAAAVATARRLGAAPLLVELRTQGGPAATRTASRPGGALTAREREVLDLVAQGRSNREIGQVLFISGKTVSVHVSNVLAKLGAGGRTEAVALARRRGLLD